jgi:2-methylaconitate cis-trans-isomerase PrpF
MAVQATMVVDSSGASVRSVGLFRTARRLMDGRVYAPEAVWQG